MSIKMICSDLDGTLLTYEQTSITDKLIEQIRYLHSKGIVFVPTSGRQITSVYKLFEKVADCCYFVCSNGAVICDGSGKVIIRQPMLKEDACAIARDFWENSDGRGEVSIAGISCCHVLHRNIGMVDRLKFIGNEYREVNVPEEVEEDIIKVSGFFPDGSDKFIDRYSDKWIDYNPAVSGPYWIDATASNKGSGIIKLCDHLGISINEVAAFGDNYNDVAMLDIVGYPYIMSSAADELLARYGNHTDNVEESLDKLITFIN